MLAKLPRQHTALHYLTNSAFCCQRQNTASIYCKHPDVTNAASAMRLSAFRDDFTAGDPSTMDFKQIEFKKMEFENMDFKRTQFKHCCLCRPGMRADFSVFQHNLLGSLTGDLSAIPEVVATFVDGQCSFGCSAFPLAPSNAPSATPSEAPSTPLSTAASSQSSQPR